MRQISKRQQKIRKQKAIKNTYGNFFSARGREDIKSKIFRYRRRLLQSWRWRPNRKAFRVWKRVRYLNPYKLIMGFPVRNRTNFKQNWLVKRYWLWKLKVKLDKISVVEKVPTSLVYASAKIRNTSSMQRSVRFNNALWYINGKPQSWLTQSHGAVTNLAPAVKMRLFLNKAMRLESARLLKTIVARSTVNSYSRYKYNPFLQRDLNFIANLNNYS